MSSATSLSGVSNAVKLELYGLFKLLTVAPTPNTQRPSFFDMTGRTKWDAWAQASKDYDRRLPDAETRYLDIARDLGWKEGVSATQDEREDASSSEEQSEEGGGGSGMGIMVSTLMPATVEETSTSELHRLVVGGDANVLHDYVTTMSGTEVNERDEFGYTALHLAADRGNIVAIRALLAKGADRHLKDPDDFTALELANIAGHEDIAVLLNEH